MKKLLFILFLFTEFSYAYAENVKITVSGMVCSFCAQGIKKSMSKIEGVLSVEPNLESKIVNVTTDDSKHVSGQLIKQIINDAGYDVVKIERGVK